MSWSTRAAALLFATLLFAFCGLSGPVQAQNVETRFGLGAGGLLSTENGLGLSAHGRLSAPISADLSLALDLGVTGFILGGTDDAVTVFMPQVSAIINLPMRAGRLSYILAGVGAHVPLANPDRTESGPTLHFGYGRVRALQQNSIYWEVDPALLVGPDNVDLLIPVRVGIIFR